MSQQACELEYVDKKFNSLDTTNHSLTGEYASDEDGCDENMIKITHGHIPKPLQDAGFSWN
ncbi:hypothetical protein [Pseudoalteromonas sp. NBT06-2]|uniref:hypothetical protein n=1 Tax=Pseudoalteromonas sp. NBT06-2 TaxID=2025950 RepID=UPI001140D53B|nr:hypothetical protein [Pseudoalteromonas sp. NBT06-2]